MGSIFIACRWAGSLGIFAWLMVVMANSKPTEQTKDQPQDVATQVTETRSTLPPVSGTGESTVRDIMQLRARFGTGIGTPEEFQSAIESIFNTDSDATRVEKAAVYWSEDLSPKSDPATCRRDPCEQPILIGALPPLEAPMLPMLSQPMHPQPHVFPVMSLPPFAECPPYIGNVPTNFVPNYPRADRSQVLRTAARSLEESAWELEMLEEYTLADQLRKQAAGIYHQARQVQ